MARILIAWELGEDFGHVTRCYRLALALRGAGNTVALAMKATQLPGLAGLPGNISTTRAPIIRRSAPNGGPPVNFAAVLRTSGFAHAPDVAERLDVWRRIISTARPDVLVADHAPTAMLAARSRDIPYVCIGNGFTVPPAASPWPSIRPWDTVAEAALYEPETELDRVTEIAQRAVGCRHPATMRELFGAPNILDTFAELDHYGARSPGHYVGPVVSIPDAIRIHWPGSDRPRVLAYLRPGVPGFPAILAALSQLEADSICVAPGIPDEQARRLASRNLRVYATHVHLASLLEGADLAVSYGNSGFSTQALLSGVPLAMRPRFVEQALFARRVEALGAGELITPHACNRENTSSIARLLTDASFREAARTFRDAHRGYTPARSIDQCVDLITRLPT